MQYISFDFLSLKKVNIKRVFVLCDSIVTFYSYYYDDNETAVVKRVKVSPRVIQYPARESTTTMEKRVVFILSAGVLIALLLTTETEAASVRRMRPSAPAPPYFCNPSKKRFIGSLSLSLSGIGDMIFPVVDTISCVLREALSPAVGTIHI